MVNFITQSSHMIETPTILVLGIGNILWADEAFGVRCLEALNQSWSFASNVSLMDGGTQGLYLLPHVQNADRLLVFDAIDYGDTPGTLREIIGSEVPRFFGVKKMSLHQTGFQEVLSAADFTGQYPSEIVLIGVQPEELDDFGSGLRESVINQIPAAIKLGLDWLSRWDAKPTPRVNSSAIPHDARTHCHPEITAINII